MTECYTIPTFVQWFWPRKSCQFFTWFLIFPKIVYSNVIAGGKGAEACFSGTRWGEGTAVEVADRETSMTAADTEFVKWRTEVHNYPQDKGLRFDCFSKVHAF